MRGRGPRGLGGVAGGRALIPIAWGTVVWSAGVPTWQHAGGEFGDLAPQVSGGGPFSVALIWARPHTIDELIIHVSPGAAKYAFEAPSLRAAQGCIVTAEDASADFTITVYEEH